MELYYQLENSKPVNFCLECKAPLQEVPFRGVELECPECGLCYIKCGGCRKLNNPGEGFNTFCKCGFITCNLCGHEVLPELNGESHTCRGCG